MTVKFYFSDSKITIPRRTQLKKTIVQIFTDKKRHLERLSYIFCSDEYLLALNQSHLQHDYYTDIITFDLSENSRTIIGEIYISVDRVKDNAQTLKTPVNEELHRVIFHGALHLCGLKDKEPKQAKEMRKAEDLYLKRYFQ